MTQLLASALATWCCIAYALAAPAAAGGKSKADAGRQALRHLSVWLRGDTVTAPASIQLNGALNGTWNGTCAARGARRCAALHTFGIYADVLSLAYTFEDASAYDFGVPRLRASGGRATARAIDFSTDVEERRGEVTVEHQCATLSPAAATARVKRLRGDTAALRRADTTLVTFELPIARSAVLALAWRKVCGHGPHHALDYGLTQADGGAVSLKAARAPVVVGPEATATSVWLRTERGAGAPRFRPPHLRLSGAGAGDVTATVRAWTPRATGASFAVLYGCGARGRVLVTATLALPPFDNATFAWTKDCGGGAERTLRVTAGDFGTVLSDGAAAPDFTRTAAPTVGNTLSHDALRVHFAVAGRQGLALGAVSVESSDTAVVRPRVWVERARRQAGTVVVVALRCRRVGEVQLRVTLPVQDRVPAEWSFYKRCVGPQRAVAHKAHFAGAVALVAAVLIIMARVVRAVPAKPQVRKNVRFERIDLRTE